MAPPNMTTQPYDKDKPMTEAQRERFAEALHRLAGDEELFVAMGTMVVDDAPAIVAELAEQIDNNKLDEAVSTSHKLKGLLSTFETHGVVPQIQQITTAARDGDQSESQALLKSARPGIDHLIHEIREVVNLPRLDVNDHTNA